MQTNANAITSQDQFLSSQDPEFPDPLIANLLKKFSFNILTEIIKVAFQPNQGGFLEMSLNSSVHNQAHGQRQCAQSKSMHKGPVRVDVHRQR